MVGLLIAVIALGFSFSLVETAVGGGLLDLLGTGAEAKARLAEMSAEQKTAHLWVTLIIDTLYPLTNGGLLAGLIWRFAGGMRRGFVLAPAAFVLCDLSENTVQMIALLGNEALLGLKDVLTPAKFGLFALSAGLVLVSVVLAVVRRIRNPASNRS